MESISKKELVRDMQSFRCDISTIQSGLDKIQKRIDRLPDDPPKHEWKVGDWYYCPNVNHKVGQIKNVSWVCQDCIPIPTPHEIGTWIHGVYGAGVTMPITKRQWNDKKQDWEYYGSEYGHFSWHKDATVIPPPQFEVGEMVKHYTGNTYIIKNRFFDNGWRYWKNFDAGGDGEENLTRVPGHEWKVGEWRYCPNVNHKVGQIKNVSWVCQDCIPIPAPRFEVGWIVKHLALANLSGVISERGWEKDGAKEVWTYKINDEWASESQIRRVPGHEWKVGEWFWCGHLGIAAQYDDKTGVPTNLDFPIPAPKFEIGETVKHIGKPAYGGKILSRIYSSDSHTWAYQTDGAVSTGFLPELYLTREPDVPVHEWRVDEWFFDKDRNAIYQIHEVTMHGRLESRAVDSCGGTEIRWHDPEYCIPVHFIQTPKSTIGEGSIVRTKDGLVGSATDRRGADEWFVYTHGSESDCDWYATSELTLCAPEVNK